MVKATLNKVLKLTDYREPRAWSPRGHDTLREAQSAIQTPRPLKAESVRLVEITIHCTHPSRQFE